MCPYDVAGLLFHKPVIQHLVGNGLADRVAVIYLLNEFDYRSDYSNAEAWPNCTSTPQQCRDEALAYTTNRVLATGRTAAAGHVPVGVKLPATTDSRSAFRRPATGKPDQLAWLLGTVMGPNKDILGYDAYWWPTNAFDIANRDRLAPWLGSFANGRFELSEYGRACESNGPCQFNADNKSGRTTPIDIRDLSKNWPTAGGFNLFAFNATGSGGCFAIYVSGSGFCTTGGNTGVTGQAELQALSQQINTLTGSTSPQPCQ